MFLLIGYLIRRWKRYQAARATASNSTPTDYHRS